MFINYRSLLALFLLALAHILSLPLLYSAQRPNDVRALGKQAPVLRPASPLGHQAPVYGPATCTPLGHLLGQQAPVSGLNYKTKY